MSHRPIYSDAEVIANHRKMAQEALGLEAAWRLNRKKKRPIAPETETAAQDAADITGASTSGSIASVIA